ncbi:MAG TPA: cytochrome P460 family protein [Edaphobacter sp.]|uniref:cytochrome P460 family protein n=1 Tax=Edaphobacter sp. TaxID=1934404 RepID=UPI002CC10DA2|nr:cytochrome P460 family protein [Edaphobacter sp.]HUZ95180.1 cytochrome P460 family protein [Edaphobacter sp.]
MKASYLFGAVFSLGILSVIGCSNPYPPVVATLSQGAVLPGNLPSNPMQDRVITSWIDRRDATMSTLYGNDLAVQYSRTSQQQDYPSGSTLSLVTWTQQEDPRWFGAKIPAKVKSVEYVMVKTGPDHRTSYTYESYEGSPLRKVAAQQSPTPTPQAAYLLSQRAAVMP